VEETVDDGMGFVDELLEVVAADNDDDDDDDDEDDDDEDDDDDAAVDETIVDSPESEKGVQFAIKGAVIDPNTGG